MSEFDQIKQLLEYSDWPSAVYPELICDINSEEEKIDRAKQIKNTMLDDIAGQRFLDFGCGEGHLAMLVGEMGSTSVGYDIIEENSFVDTSLEDVIKKGPYDTVLLYDVLDHCDDPIQALQAIKLVLAPNVKVVIRCHPWCSRHGGHLYRDINKSHIHLILSEEEMNQLGVDLSEFPKQKVVYPISSYKKWFTDSGFKIKNQNITTENVPLFFKDKPVIKKKSHNLGKTINFLGRETGRNFN